MRFLIFAEQTLTLIFWILITFGFDTPRVAILTLLAVLIHESGHLFALRKTRKASSAMPRARLSGFRIKIGILSYGEELFSALAGPLFNLFAGGVCLFFGQNPTFLLFSALNIMTAVSNLLPIRGYDGYKAILCVLYIFSCDGAKAESVLRQISFLLSAALTLFSLFLMLKLGEGYWIFFIFFSVLLSEITERLKHTI